MARNENPPFERGLTGYNGATIDTNNLFGFQDIGKDWLFEDVSPTTKQARTNKYVRCRVVRNVSGISLLPKRLIQFDTSNSPKGGTGVLDPAQTFTDAAIGYSTGDGVAPQSINQTFPIDEYLPSAGVPNNDVFWIVVEGPALCKTPLNAFNANINVGDKVVAASTAAATTGTTAGRVEAVSYIAGTQPSATTQRQNVRQDTDYVGYALSALTTGQTDADILVDVRPM